MRPYRSSYIEVASSLEQRTVEAHLQFVVALLELKSVVSYEHTQVFKSPLCAMEVSLW